MSEHMSQSGFNPEMQDDREKLEESKLVMLTAQEISNPENPRPAIMVSNGN